MDAKASNAIPTVYPSTPPYSKGARSSHQYFSLRWNNYQSNMTSVFHELLETQSFVDVTLACEYNSLKAHKVWYKKKVYYNIIEKLFTFRWCFQHVLHISKKYCLTTLVNILPSFYHRIYVSQICNSSSSLFIEEKSTYRRLNYRYVSKLDSMV